jgi:outer membrane phospholipase A
MKEPYLGSYTLDLSQSSPQIPTSVLTLLHWNVDSWYGAVFLTLSFGF